MSMLTRFPGAPFPGKAGLTLARTLVTSSVASLAPPDGALNHGIAHKGLASAAADPAAGVVLPDLSYDYGALEPVISGEIMQLHHAKHHQTYVNNLNVALEKQSEAIHKNDHAAMIANQGAIKFNGGGHVNHSIFWTNLCPKKDYAPPSGNILKMINRDFGSLEKLQASLSSTTVAVQGSGWGWLGYDTDKKKLFTASCANQDPLQAAGPYVPLLGIDVWEHAYYLQYKNVRPDYVKAIWEIVNWSNVAERLEKATG